MWGGRFSNVTHSNMKTFNSSLSFDKRMWRQDIMGSKAYANALRKVHLLSSEESESIKDGLQQIEMEWQNGSFVTGENDEDIHSANERRLQEIIGSAAGKLHTGRSRNDQVTTDMRLWLREEMKLLGDLLLQLTSAILRRAKEETHIVMPGYTHLQRAQPILWSHWLLSYCWMLQRDCKRLREVYQRVNEMTLGSGALAGNPFGIDRESLAVELGFSSVTQNSLDATGDRDFVVEFLFWCSMLTNHLSRLSEDLIIYSSKEFGFLSISDEFSTGSSLMPQKKNADSLELMRGKSGRLIGHLTGFMATCKGLPSSYNKDLQEDKEVMFDARDTVAAVLSIATGVITTLKVNDKVCKSALSFEMLSTDLAYYLVRKGVPFREAHNLAGQCVKRAESKKCKINELTVEDFQSISDKFSANVMCIWCYESSIEQYTTTGGTSLTSVKKQVAEMEVWLKSKLSAK